MRLALCEVRGHTSRRASRGHEHEYSAVVGRANEIYAGLHSEIVSSAVATIRRLAPWRLTRAAFAHLSMRSIVAGQNTTR